LAWTATSDDLADAIRECAALPDAGTLTDAEIFRVADRAIQMRFVPFMRDLRENFWTKTSDTTMTVGTADYRIPSDAQGATVRLVTIVDSAGVERHLPQVPMQYDERWNQSGEPVAFCIFDDKVRLFPAPSVANTLRLVYYRRPSKLVAVSACMPVLEVEGTTVLRIGSYASFGETGTYSIDVVQANPHFTSVVDGASGVLSSTGTAINIASAIGLAITIDAGSGWTPEVGDIVSQSSVEYSITTVTSATIFRVGATGLAAGAAFGFENAVTIAAGGLTSVTAGDYISEHMETCVVQLPAELYYALVSATAAQILNSDGDAEGYARESTECDRLMANARSILAPRADGAPKLIVGHNSPLRGGSRRRYGWDTA
jgi:hypothetical protein